MSKAINLTIMKSGGKIVYCALSTKNNVIDFDIANVIGDFMHVRYSYSRNWLSQKYRYDFFTGHPFTKIYKDINNFDVEDEEFEKAFKIIEAVLLLYGQGYTLIKYEEARSFLDSVNKLKVTPSGNERTFKGNAETIITHVSEKNFSELYKADTMFEYKCDSLSEIVAAVIHYYLVNRYKLKKCKHCGELFATDNLNRKYCLRISPYKNNYSQKASSPYNCEQMVRYIILLMKGKIKIIDNRLRNRMDYHLGNLVIRDTCIKRCRGYLNEVTANPTIENINKYTAYLDIENTESRWKNEHSNLC